MLSSNMKSLSRMAVVSTSVWTPRSLLLHKPILASQISQRRHNSTNDLVTPPNIQWNLIDSVEKFQLTGPVLPWSELNFVQKLVAPYTYSVMHYMDQLLTVMPWWATIITATATFRILFLPFHVKQIKIGIRSYNIMPQQQRLQAKMNDYLASGDSFQAAQTKTKLALLMKDNDITIRKRLLPIFAQAPMFLTTFFLLRRLSHDELESMATGGALWFTNLLQYDPYFILPLMTSASLLALFEFGLEGGMTPSAQMPPIIRWVLRVFPLGLFFLTFKFPAALLLFWTTNNFFTLFYALFFQRKSVKKFFSIPDRVEHPAGSLPLTQQSFSEQLKKAKEQSRAAQTSFDVRRLDDVAFRKAGLGPIKKTYKNPN